jgi:hypothetical protein
MRIMNEITIRTTEEGWFKHLVEVYKNRTPILLIDDARVGIDPSNESLVTMGLKAKLSPAEWAAVGVALGISAAGIMMVILAFVDPEPTSKLGLLVGGGVLCVLTGGGTAIYVLTKLRPPNVHIGATGIQISWI